MQNLLQCSREKSGGSVNTSYRVLAVLGSAAFTRGSQWLRVQMEQEEDGAVGSGQGVAPVLLQPCLGHPAAGTGLILPSSSSRSCTTCGQVLGPGDTPGCGVKAAGAGMETSARLPRQHGPHTRTCQQCTMVGTSPAYAQRPHKMILLQEDGGSSGRCQRAAALA